MTMLPALLLNRFCALPRFGSRRPKEGCTPLRTRTCKDELLRKPSHDMQDLLWFRVREEDAPGSHQVELILIALILHVINVDIPLLRSHLDAVIPEDIAIPPH